MEVEPEIAMSASTHHDSVTFPRGFLDFLQATEDQPHCVGAYELDPQRLEHFNAALRELSPDAPTLTLDQFAAAAERALARHRNGSTPPFVASRMAALVRLREMAADGGWAASAEMQRQVAVLDAYRRDGHDLVPDEVPVIGLLDDAVLVDVALQLLRSDLADYEDFCRFRRVASQFSGIPEAELGLTREHWLEALLQAHDSLGRIDAPVQQRYVPDPRASLFHIT
jgi:hypothetical protein